MRAQRVDIIDKLGAVRAEIADLEVKALSYERTLKRRKPGIYEGTLYRVCISKFKRDCLDLEAVRRKLTPQFLRRHTSQVDVTRLTVTAR